MKKTIIILLLTCPLISLCQSTWRKGIVVTKDGTTLEGMINDREWHANPTSIEFQKDGQAIQIFTTNDIRSFATSRPVRYEAHYVEYDGDEQAIRNLPETRESTNLKKDSIFLKVIINGTISLLQLSEENNRKHFFLGMDSKVTELLYREYRFSSTAMAANEKFKQQLILITNGCPEIQAKIRNMKYAESSLRNIIGKINQCRGYDIAPVWTGEVTPQKHSSMGITVQTFFNYTEFTFLTSDFSKPNFGAGIFYEVYTRKRPNRVSLYNEVVFKHVSQTARGYFYAPYDAIQHGDLQMTRIKLVNALRFSYPSRGGGRFFWNVGLENGVRMHTTFDGQTDPDIENEFEWGLMFGAGKTFVIGKSFKLATELRYELEQGPIKETPFIGSHNFGLSVQLGLR